MAAGNATRAVWTRRLGSVAALVLGSVASEVLRFAAVPVTLVRES